MHRTVKQRVVQCAKSVTNTNAQAVFNCTDATAAADE